MVGWGIVKSFGGIADIKIKHSKERSGSLMGLSASQARLLSITSRLSDNELRTQTITTAKTALAGKTSQASREYLAALDETNMYFSTYDSDGNKTRTPLTGFCLTEYAPLKNQYGIINADGQILVSETDAQNYLESANIAEFLEKYGFENAFRYEEKTQINEGAYQTAMDGYRDEYNAWIEKEPPRTITQVVQEAYDEVIESWTEYTEPWTETVHSSELYEQVMSTGCIGGAISDRNCYMHVMASLIGPGTHKTSDGVSYNIYPYSDHCEEHDEYWCWNTDQHPVDESLREALKHRYPCGEVHDEYVEIMHNGSAHLVWCKDEDCSSDKSVYQKIVDLLWEVHDDYRIGSSIGGSATDENIAQFWHIIEFDLDDVTIVEHPAEEIVHPEEIIHHDAVIEEVPNPAYDEWVNNPPKEPDIKEFEYTITELRVDQESEEGQWYINLWHRMNGASIYKTTIEGFENGVHDPENDGVIEGDNIKSPTNGLTENGKPLWAVLEDGLMNSPEWLNWALHQGIVTLERVNFTEPTENGTGINHYTWTPIIYSNALDITEEENEKAITKAEVKYQLAMKDIEAKDKQYDNMIRRLDTEHNALQTEYDSIKNVIGKNIERTLKLYS